MLKRFLQNATVHHVLRSLLFGLVMAALACLTLTLTYPNPTLANYLGVGVVIGVFGFASWLYLPLAIGITTITGGTMLWGLFDGIPINVAEALTLLPASVIPILLALWRLWRRQENDLSA